MKIDLYTIETLTNLHVGSGDINFDIVDNQVQRDAISGLPNINSSSLKGAFREHFESKDDTKCLVEYIFGSDNKTDDNKTKQGNFSFFEAQLLTRPVRSNKKAYFNATSPKVIENFLEAIENFNIEFDEELKKELKKLSEIEVKDKAVIFTNITDAILEDSESEYKEFDTSKIEKFLGKDLALFSDEEFKKLSLPVIARNHLEDGVSKNLWYEEVVPKKSKFYFFIGKPENIADKNKIEGFENRFNKEGARLQIGANKSIGYGFTKIKKVLK
jgi:CRISPR-associated protein Cmr4